jgi:hypothetical protein
MNAFLHCISCRSGTIKTKTDQGKEHPFLCYLQQNFRIWVFNVRKLNPISATNQGGTLGLNTMEMLDWGPKLRCRPGIEASPFSDMKMDVTAVEKRSRPWFGKIIDSGVDLSSIRRPLVPSSLPGRGVQRSPRLQVEEIIVRAMQNASTINTSSTSWRRGRVVQSIHLPRAASPLRPPRMLVAAACCNFVVIDLIWRDDRAEPQCQSSLRCCHPVREPPPTYKVEIAAWFRRSV